MKTVEQIWKEATEHSDTYLGQIRYINKAFRQGDESHKWPINGRFNATERAIRRTRKDCACNETLSYAYCVEAKIVEIVDREV